MLKGSLIKRVKKAEAAAKAQLKFSAECICFPEKEQPFFCTPLEEEIAASLKCPLHGNRFKQPIFHIYVSQWRRDREAAHGQRQSAQYRKAWEATFPRDSSPLANEETAATQG